MANETLTIFEDGDTIVADTVNENFQYCLADTSARVGTLQTSTQASINSINSNISTLQGSVYNNTSDISQLQTTVNTINTQLSYVGCPNYYAGFWLSWDLLISGYSAPVNGIVYMSIYPASERKDNYIYVNGVFTGVHFNGPSSNADFSSATILLGAGDIISVGNDISTPRGANIMFFPLK